MKILSWANIQYNLRHFSNELNDRNLSKLGQNKNRKKQQQQQNYFFYIVAAPNNVHAAILWVELG